MTYSEQRYTRQHKNTLSSRQFENIQHNNINNDLINKTKSIIHPDDHIPNTDWIDRPLRARPVLHRPPTPSQSTASRPPPEARGPLLPPMPPSGSQPFTLGRSRQVGELFVPGRYTLATADAPLQAFNY